MKGKRIFYCEHCKRSIKIKSKYDISVHKKFCNAYKSYRDKILTKKFLVKEYIKNGRSAKEISTKHGIPVGRIIKMISNFKLKTRTLKESILMPRCKKRTENTNLKRYGAINPLSKNTIPYNKRNETVKNKYGVDNVFQVPAIIKRIQKTVSNWRIPGVHKLNFNPKAIPIIEAFGKEHGCNFRHAQNHSKGEFSILGYFADGYDEKNNVWIEVDEKHHFYKNGKLKRKDVRRQKEIQKFLKCKFIRIKYEDKKH